MGSATQQVIAFITIPVAVMLIGGFLAAYFTPSPTMRSSFQHFAAGLVFAAVAMELLPDMRHHSMPAVIVGFTLGVALMLLIRHFTRKGKHGHAVEGDGVTSLLLIVAVDFLVDGLLIGVGFVASLEQGILITIALTLEALFLSVATTTTLKAEGVSLRRIALTLTGLAVILAASAIVGATLFAGVSGAPFAIVLSFGAAALLYLVTEELLVEAHAIKETPVSAAMFFVGFLALLLLEMGV